MNKQIVCDIHSNCQIFHIDVLQDQEKKLKCVQSIANKKKEMSFIYIPQIINVEENLFLDNWPPLSDDLLREKIIQLRNEDKDVSQQIIDFYEKFTEEVVKILSEKKKESLIQVEKLQQLKDKIINQYCDMASLDKISKCFTQDNESIEQIEKNLKECLDSQFNRIEEFTSILQQMMRQYELISDKNIQRNTQIKENILNILRIVNLLPQNNFNFGDEMFGFDKIKAYQQVLDQEYEINQKKNCKIDYLINQLDICNQYLIQKMNQKDWYLDDLLLSQQSLISKYQIDKVDNVKDIYFNYYQLKSELQKNESILNQTSFKYYNEFLCEVRLKPNIITFSNYNNSNQYLASLIGPKGQLWILRKKSGASNVHCYLNYILKPKKKYLFRINFYKSKNQSTFYIGLLDSQQNNNNNSIYQNTFGFSISQIRTNQNQANQNADSKVIAYSLEFRICIEKQQMQYTVYPSNSNVVQSYRGNSQVNGSYYLAFEFQYDYLGDRLEIFDFQELEEFPN